MTTLAQQWLCMEGRAAAAAACSPAATQTLGPIHCSFRFRHRQPPRISESINRRKSARSPLLSSSRRQAPPLPLPLPPLAFAVGPSTRCTAGSLRRPTPRYITPSTLACLQLPAEAARSQGGSFKILLTVPPAARSSIHRPFTIPPSSPPALQPAMASTPTQRARMLLSINIAVLVVLGPYALLAPAGAAAHLFGDARAGRVASLLDMSPPSGGSPLFSYQMLGAALCSAMGWCRGSVQG